MPQRLNVPKPQPSNETYDAAILGAGLGGLLCAVILAKRGMKVCVLEKDKQAGGCLQSFSLHKQVFDSCVHYIGGLGEGHTLHQIFRYAGIMGDMRLEALNPEGFDHVAFGDEEATFPIANAAHFVDALAQQFPTEKNNLERYLALLKRVGDCFPLYRLRNGEASEKDAVAHLELSATIDSLTANPRLRQVLLGNSMLYAGGTGVTPFYLHALVMESYLHSAHKVAPASSDITRLLVRELRQHGGEVFRNEALVALEVRDGLAKTAVAASGRRVEARQFIANIAPAALLPLIQTNLFRPAFRKRIAAQPQTISTFMVNLVLKPGVVRYTGSNLYWNRSADALAGAQYRPADWPANYALFFTADAARPGFASALSILSYMHFEETLRWAGTENTTAQEAQRGRDYEDWKAGRTERLINEVARRMPDLPGAIVAQSAASPLTYRDYTATPQGSLYGVMKDVCNPAMTTIAARTKIPNLLLTGQNVNLHGVLGVSITALATCGELVGLSRLIEDVRKA